MHGKGTLEVSLACLTRPYYVQGAPREEKGPNQFREKLGGLRLLTGLALYKAPGKMFCRLNCLVCTAYPISPAITNLGPRNSCRSSTELLLAPFADLAFSHLLTREGNQLSRSY